MTTRIRWKKIGGGTFRMASGKIIKPGQVFEAAEADIPLAFRDVVVPLDDLPEEQPLEVATGGYSVRSRGPGWYDIVDASGKVVNERALRRDEADQQLRQLLG